MEVVGDRQTVDLRICRGDPALRTLFKILFTSLAALIALPVWVVTRVLIAVSSDSDRFFHWTCQWVSAWPGPLGEYARREVLAHLLEACPRDVCISFGTVFSRRESRLGRRAYLGVGCNIGLVDLGADCLLGSGVHILSGKQQHHAGRTDIPIREQGGTYDRVQIGEGTWIGNAAVVLANVGRQCIIGAGSVVTKDLPDGAIAVGNPARVHAWREGFEPQALTDGSDVDA